MAWRDVFSAVELVLLEFVCSESDTYFSSEAVGIVLHAVNKKTVTTIKAVFIELIIWWKRNINNYYYSKS
jgi:hypothetical protein